MGLFDFLREDGPPDWVPTSKRGRYGQWLLMESHAGNRSAMRPRQGWAKVAASYRKAGISRRDEVRLPWRVVDAYDADKHRRISPSPPPSVERARAEFIARLDADARRTALRRERTRESDRKKRAREAKARADREATERRTRTERSVMSQMDRSYLRGFL